MKTLAMYSFHCTSFLSWVFDSLHDEKYSEYCHYDNVLIVFLIYLEIGLHGNNARSIGNA